MSKKNSYEITKVCAFCELAECMHDKEKMLCSLKGVVSAGYKCKKFLYDPLKRSPEPIRIIKVSPEDLML
ncbi:MAG: hypothetical protein E7591_02625 [Ruminococcaceae bacterium]|nr:hypothetical protein [Oscillospiraceae bacterium]